MCYSPQIVTGKHEIFPILRCLFVSCVFIVSTAIGMGRVFVISLSAVIMNRLPPTQTN